MDQPLMTSTAAIMMLQLFGAIAVVDSADWRLSVSSEYSLLLLLTVFLPLSECTVHMHIAMTLKYMNYWAS